MEQYIKKFIDEVLLVSKVQLKAGCFDPKVFFCGKIYKSLEPMIFPIPQADLFFRDERTKNLLKPALELIYTTCKEEKVLHSLDAVIVISDVFMSQYHYDKGSKDSEKFDEAMKDSKYPKGIPSAMDDPNHLEGLMIAINYPDHTDTLFYAYTRKDGVIIFKPGDKIIEPSQNSGRMAMLFPNSAKADIKREGG